MFTKTLWEKSIVGQFVSQKAFSCESKQILVRFSDKFRMSVRLLLIMYAITRFIALELPPV